MKSLNTLKIAVLCTITMTSCSKGIKLSELALKDKLYYNANEQKPFTGKVYEAYLSGKDSLVANIDSGMFNGDYLLYYPTGEIKDSVVYEKGIIVKYKRFLTSGLVLKTPQKILFQSKQGLTCTIDEKKDTVPFSGLSVGNYSDKSRYEKNYINGELTGVATEYFPNDKVSSITNFRNSVAVGAYIAYFDNGSLKEQGKYPNEGNSGRIGKWTTYYINKKIDEVGIYLNGKKDSTWTTYYENGKIKGTANYSNGTDNGPFVDYYENGNVKIRGTFQNGLKEGEWTWYRSNGVVDSKGKYSHGKSLSKCDCCGNFYNYDEGWTARNPGFSSGAWDVFADGGAGGGPYCSKGCARRCE
ncbi:MAG: toxin-antitoxin system YwqK family antitoxin [Paludibacter sp.]